MRTGVVPLCLFLVLTLATLPARADDDLRQRALSVFAPLPDRIETLQGEPVTAEKIALGQMLFFDPRLSDTGTHACATCHNPATGGDSNRETSVGHLWQGAPQNAPTVFNAALNSARFWQGWAEDLTGTRSFFMETAAERTLSPGRVVSVLTSMPGYVEAFRRAFPGETDPVTHANFARALAHFETVLLTPAPFDAWLRGDDAALSSEARAGLALFMDAGCADCHRGVNLGGNDYYPFRVQRIPGTEDQPESAACYRLTESDGEAYLYRAGTLRNIRLTAPYFSEGSVWSLDLAVEIMGRSQLGTELRAHEVTRITAFLDSLTGTPPRIEVPILPAETQLTPKPDLPLFE